jgi:hypothetical protein
MEKEEEFLRRRKKALVKARKVILDALLSSRKFAIHGYRRGDHKELPLFIHFDVNIENDVGSDYDYAFSVKVTMDELRDILGKTTHLDVMQYLRGDHEVSTFFREFWDGEALDD